MNLVREQQRARGQRSISLKPKLDELRSGAASLDIKTSNQIGLATDSSGQLAKGAETCNRGSLSSAGSSSGCSSVAETCELADSPASSTRRELGRPDHSGAGSPLEGGAQIRKELSRPDKRPSKCGGANIARMTTGSSGGRAQVDFRRENWRPDGDGGRGATMSEFSAFSLRRSLEHKVAVEAASVGLMLHHREANDPKRREAATGIEPQKVVHHQAFAQEFQSNNNKALKLPTSRLSLRPQAKGSRAGKTIGRSLSGARLIPREALELRSGGQLTFGERKADDYCCCCSGHCDTSKRGVARPAPSWPRNQPAGGHHLVAPLADRVAQTNRQPLARARGVQRLRRRPPLAVPPPVVPLYKEMALFGPLESAAECSGLGASDGADGDEDGRCAGQARREAKEGAALSQASAQSCPGAKSYYCDSWENLRQFEGPQKELADFEDETHLEGPSNCSSKVTSTSNQDAGSDRSSEHFGSTLSRKAGKLLERIRQSFSVLNFNNGHHQAAVSPDEPLEAEQPADCEGQADLRDDERSSVSRGKLVRSLSVQIYDTPEYDAQREAKKAEPVGQPTRPLRAARPAVPPPLPPTSPRSGRGDAWQTRVQSERDCANGPTRASSDSSMVSHLKVAHELSSMIGGEPSATKPLSRSELASRDEKASPESATKTAADLQCEQAKQKRRKAVKWAEDSCEDLLDKQIDPQIEANSPIRSREKTRSDRPEILDQNLAQRSAEGRKTPQSEAECGAAYKEANGVFADDRKGEYEFA